MNGVKNLIRELLRDFLGVNELPTREQVVNIARAFDKAPQSQSPDRSPAFKAPELVDDGTDSRVVRFENRVNDCYSPDLDTYISNLLRVVEDTSTYIDRLELENGISARGGIFGPRY